jgi:FkbM family methyltransferase
MKVKSFVRAITPAPLWRAAMRMKRHVMIRIGKRSHSAHGEDLLICHWLQHHGCKLSDACYVDVGAAHPIELSNTYLLYRAGARGILVEPDPDQARVLRAKRPKDIVVNAGVAFDERRSARLIRMTARVFNTFSREQAEHCVRVSETWEPHERQKIIDEIEIPLIPINEIISTHLPGRRPHLISIDTEGVELQILKSLDLGLLDVPAVVCVEASVRFEEFDSILRPAGFEMMARTSDNWLFHRY